MRRTIVDTVTTVVFFTFVASVTELFIAGMAPAQVLVTRLVMIPLMIATARPYSTWRDWFFVRTRPTVTWSKTLIDTIAFVVFQLPIYMATLLWAGASWAEISTLLPVTTAAMVVLSRPFGRSLEVMRHLCRA